MRISNYFSLLILALVCPPSAFALETPTAIKASVILKAESSWDGKPIIYPNGKPEITGMIIEIAPGGESGWHSHPVSSFGIVLEGELEVQLKNGAVKRLKAGEASAEVINTLHNARNPGSTTAKIVVFYAGAVGQKLTVKEHSE